MRPYPLPDERVRWRSGAGRALLALFLLGGGALALVPYTAPSGDLNGDGSVDAVDIQCQVLLYERTIVPIGCAVDADCEAAGPGATCGAGFFGVDICLPACLGEGTTVGRPPPSACTDPFEDSAGCLGLVPRAFADLDCDNALTATDLTFLVQVATKKAGGPNTADLDQDGRLNFCDEDMDGDGILDLVDPCPGLCRDEANPICGMNDHGSGSLFVLYANDCELNCAEEPPNVECGLDGISYPDKCRQLKCNGDSGLLGLYGTRCATDCPNCP